MRPCSGILKTAEASLCLYDFVEMRYMNENGTVPKREAFGETYYSG